MVAEPSIAVNAWGTATIVFGQHPAYPNDVLRYAISCHCGVTSFDLYCRGTARQRRAWDWVRAAVEYHYEVHPDCDCLGPTEEFTGHLN